MVRVVQYNILSTELASPFFYVHTETKFLKPDSRWTLLKQKLVPEIDQESIFCLQEVSLDWLEKLVPFFRQYGYQCEYNNYGWTVNGYMGICIAYPNKYRLEAMKMFKVGEVIQEKTLPLKLTKYQRLQKKFFIWVFWLLSIFGLSNPKSNEDSWLKAIKKQNTLLCLRLSENEKAFCIGTYHMPCSYKDQSIMLLHTVTCIQLMNKFAGNYRYILAGDFNFKPDSLMYKVVTTGGNYNSYVDVSLNLDTSMCSVKLATPMKSVYSYIGQEPLYTNFSHVKDHEPFNGCLDYIFISRGWKVLSVKELPSQLPQTSYPSGDEPSDHLLLAANLELIEKSVE